MSKRIVIVVLLCVVTLVGVMLFSGIRARGWVDINADLSYLIDESGGMLVYNKKNGITTLISNHEAGFNSGEETISLNVKDGKFASLSASINSDKLGRISVVDNNMDLIWDVLSVRKGEDYRSFDAIVEDVNGYPDFTWKLIGDAK